MHSLKFSSALLAGLAAAGALAMGLLVAPPTSHAGNLALMAQDQPEAKGITISGTALTPEGEPASNLPVLVKQMELRAIGAGGPGGGGGRQGPQLSSQPGGDRYRTIGRATTDESGGFTVRNVTARPGISLRLEIGERTRSAWTIQTVRNEGKDVDLGEVRLRERVAR